MCSLVYLSLSLPRSRSASSREAGGRRAGDRGRAEPSREAVLMGRGCDAQIEHPRVGDERGDLRDAPFGVVYERPMESLLHGLPCPLNTWRRA